MAETLNKEIDASYALMRNPRNKYLQDRESMKNGNFSGMGLINLPQDAAMVQGQGAIQDRTREHLGNGDKAIIAFRRALLEKVLQLQSGKKDVPDAATSGSGVFVVSELMPASENWRDYCKKFTRKSKRFGRSAVG